MGAVGPRRLTCVAGQRYPGRSHGCRRALQVMGYRSLMRRNPFAIALIALVLFFFLAGPSLVSFYTDWLWYGEVGYRQVYSTTLKAQGTLFTIVFAIAAVWLTLNLRTALASIGDTRPTLVTRQGLEVPLPGQRQLQTLASGAAVVVALLVALFAASEWEVWLAWRHAVPFGQADPVFGYDVGFYVFTLPFLQFVHG